MHKYEEFFGVEWPGGEKVLVDIGVALIREPLTFIVPEELSEGNALNIRLPILDRFCYRLPEKVQQPLLNWMVDQLKLPELYERLNDHIFVPWNDFARAQVSTMLVDWNHNIDRKAIHDAFVRDFGVWPISRHWKVVANNKLVKDYMSEQLTKEEKDREVQV